MKTKCTIVFTFLLFFFATCLIAQPQYEPFIHFFRPLVGTWECTVQDFDSTGTSTWQEVQTRTFIATIDGNFLQENTYSRRYFEPKHAGLFIYSYDPAAKKVYCTGFWVRSAGHIFEITANIESNTNVKGIMKLKQQDGTLAENRIEWLWTSADEFLLRVYRKDHTGKEYRGEELKYKRMKM